MKTKQSIELINVERTTNFNFKETNIDFKYNGFSGYYTILEDIESHSISHIVRYFEYCYIDSKVFEKITAIANMEDYNTTEFIKAFNQYFNYQLPN